MAKKLNYPASSFVSFKNSQGSEARGSLMRLSRQQVVFEVYNPFSVVQLSEVLSELRIFQGDRETYHGRAVVTSLLNTGLMLIVSASLVDPWSDLKGLKPGEVLRSYVHDFVTDWEASIERLQKPFQVSVGNLRNYLHELSRWLEHWETEAGIRETATPPELTQEFVRDVDQEITPKLTDLYAQFEVAAKGIPKKFVPYHRAYAQRELHPLMMCSPFMFRAYSKPLGYAGDYQMVNMMLTEPWDGANSFAKILNASALRHDAPAAHRNRINLLEKALRTEARRAASEGRRLKVLNIGCGPAVEVKRFLDSDPLADHTDFVLVDFNIETLDHVRRELIPHAKRRRPEMKITTEQRSINEIIQLSVEGDARAKAEYDLVYCAGLFDYFRDATCGYLLQLYYSWISEGGLVLATNVSPTHSSEAIMGLILDWNLELRSEQNMLELAPHCGRQLTYSDPTGVNVFLEIRK